MWQGERIAFFPVESHAPRKRHTRVTPLVNSAFFGNLFQGRHAATVTFDMNRKVGHIANQVFLVHANLVDRATDIIQEFNVSFGDWNKDSVRRPYSGLIQSKAANTE
jgi:hypothetical protein